MLLQEKAGALVMGLITLVGASVVTELEANLQERNVKQVEILRDHISFAWVFGGALLGSYVGVTIRQVSGLPAISRDFAVSLCTAMACTPYVLKHWFSGEPEVCFFGGFVFSVGARVVWEVVLIISDRLKLAAKKRGWLGVKDELTGRQPIAPPEPSPSGGSSPSVK